MNSQYKAILKMLIQRHLPVVTYIHPIVKGSIVEIGIDPNMMTISYDDDDLINVYGYHHVYKREGYFKCVDFMIYEDMFPNIVAQWVDMYKSILKDESIKHVHQAFDTKIIAYMDKNPLPNNRVFDEYVPMCTRLGRKLGVYVMVDVDNTRIYGLHRVDSAEPLRGQHVLYMINTLNACIDKPFHVGNAWYLPDFKNDYQYMIKVLMLRIKDICYSDPMAEHEDVDVCSGWIIV